MAREACLSSALGTPAISTGLAALSIRDPTYIYIYIVSRAQHTHADVYIYIYTQIFIFIIERSMDGWMDR